MCRNTDVLHQVTETTPFPLMYEMYIFYQEYNPKECKHCLIMIISTHEAVAILQEEWLQYDTMVSHDFYPLEVLGKDRLFSWHVTL